MVSDVIVQGLYGITPESNDDNWLLESVIAVLQAGVKVIQYRSKTKNRSKKEKQALEIAEACHKAGATFILNDDLDLFFKLKEMFFPQSYESYLSPFENYSKSFYKMGIHLGRFDLNPSFVRQELGDFFVIGASCYGNFSIAQKVYPFVDYVAFGSIFLSPTKPEAEKLSLSSLREYVIRLIPLGIPSVAIGGINATNINGVWNTGVTAVAVSDAIFGGGNFSPEQCRDNVQKLNKKLA